MKEDSRTEIRAGDILLSIVGSIGKVALAPENIDFTAQRSVSVIKTLLIDNTYLSLVFSSPYFQTTLIKKSSGTAQKGIYLGELKQILIPLPPLNEQFKIVDKFNMLLKKYSLYNSLYLSLMNLNLDFPEKLRKSILQYAMQGKLVSQDATDEPVEVLLEKIREEKQRLFEEGKLQKKDLQETIIYQGDDNSYYENQEKQLVDIPDSWKWVNIKTIAFITMGQSPKSKDVFPQKISNSIEFHQGKSFFSKFNLEESKTYTTNSNKLINKPSVLLSVRAPVGDVNYVNRPVVIGRGLAAITCYKGISVFYLFNYLFTQKNKLESIATGSTFKAINSHIINNILVPLPPRMEQKRIVDRTEKILILISKLS